MGRLFVADMVDMSMYTRSMRSVAMIDLVDDYNDEWFVKSRPLRAVGVITILMNMYEEWFKFAVGGMRVQCSVALVKRPSVASTSMLEHRTDFIPRVSGKSRVFATDAITQIMGFALAVILYNRISRFTSNIQFPSLHRLQYILRS